MYNKLYNFLADDNIIYLKSSMDLWKIIQLIWQ